MNSISFGCGSCPRGQKLVTSLVNSGVDTTIAKKFVDLHAPQAGQTYRFSAISGISKESTVHVSHHLGLIHLAERIQNNLDSVVQGLKSFAEASKR